MNMELTITVINFLLSIITIIWLWDIERELKRIKFEYALRCITPANNPTFIKPIAVPRPGGRKPMKIVTDESLFERDKKND